MISAMPCMSIECLSLEQRLPAFNPLFSSLMRRKEEREREKDWWHSLLSLPLCQIISTSINQVDSHFLFFFFLRLLIVNFLKTWSSHREVTSWLKNLSRYWQMSERSSSLAEVTSTKDRLNRCCCRRCVSISVVALFRKSILGRALQWEDADF